MIKEHLERVFEILKQNPECRDSDNKLMSEVWQQDIEGKQLDIDLRDRMAHFFDLLESNKLSSYESITRCRRKLQEQYPELRGKKWMERHIQEREMVKEIREMNKLKEQRFASHEFKTERGEIEPGNLFKE